MGIIINHYKDPYLTTSIIESKAVFFRGSAGSGSSMVFLVYQMLTSVEL